MIDQLKPYSEETTPQVDLRTVTDPELDRLVAAIFNENVTPPNPALLDAMRTVITDKGWETLAARVLALEPQPQNGAPLYGVLMLSQGLLEQTIPYAFALETLGTLAIHDGHRFLLLLLALSDTRLSAASLDIILLRIIGDTAEDRELGIVGHMQLGHTMANHDPNYALHAYDAAYRRSGTDQIKPVQAEILLHMGITFAKAHDYEKAVEHAGYAAGYYSKLGKDGLANIARQLESKFRAHLSPAPSKEEQRGERNPPLEDEATRFTQQATQQILAAAQLGMQGRNEEGRSPF